MLNVRGFSTTLLIQIRQCAIVLPAFGSDRIGSCFTFDDEKLSLTIETDRVKSECQNKMEKWRLSPPAAPPLPLLAPLPIHHCSTIVEPCTTCLIVKMHQCHIPVMPNGQSTKVI